LATDINLIAYIMVEMRAANPVMENLLPNNTSGLHFALCESCFWTATILKVQEQVACPMCVNGSVSLIPLAVNEQYRIKLEPGAGLELSFSKKSR
jgi:hypothetical protein